MELSLLYHASFTDAKFKLGEIYKTLQSGQIVYIILSEFINPIED